LVAKAVLLVGVLPFMEPFPKILTLYDVRWETLLYVFAVFSIQVLEETIRALLKHQSLASVGGRVVTAACLGDSDLGGHGTPSLLLLIGN
jgi:hypothetical protein